MYNKGMKYLVIGHAGAGKSTLAKAIAEKENIPLLYIDCVYWLPDWNRRPLEGQIAYMQEFLDNNDSWAMDGNYFKVLLDRRLKEADKIIYLNFNRFACLKRAYQRFFAYKNKSRESITDGCKETMDFAFIKWILFESRTKKRLAAFDKIVNEYKDKITIIHNQEELDKYYNELKK